MITLDTLKSYLKDLKYPGINFLCDDEIASIFDKENRLHFLTWFFTKLDPGIVLPSDENNRNDILIHILYDNGFCLYEDSIRFVQANLEFPPNEQVLLFNRMLYNLRILTSERETSEDCEVNYIDEMEKFAKLDVNIFPSLGALKTRKPKDRQQKLEEYEQEIMQIKKEIKQISSECDIENQFSQYEAGTDLDNVDLSYEIPALMSNTECLLKETIKVEKQAFNKSFEKLTNSCATNVLAVLKFYENKKQVSDFMVNDNIQEMQGNTNILENIQRLANLSEEILKI